MVVIPDVEIKYRSDYQIDWSKHVRPLIRNRYKIQSAAELSIQGDAPKDFVRLREQERGAVSSGRRRRRISRRTSKWRAYIAKVGSKWYPIESVTEQLVTRLGQIAGLRIANAQRRIVGTQVRFLSRYFLKRGEQLYHEFDMFRDLIGGEIVDEIAKARLEPAFYTFQTIDDAIAGRFPEEHAGIMRGLTEMIGFDALVGNNDRHPANWGIVVELKGARAPRFSPVFDTARGLFWNYTEDKVSKTLANPKMLESYIGRCAPQIGWDEMGKLFHFDLVQRIAENHPEYRDCLAKYAAPGFVDSAVRILESEFDPIMSRARRALILRCLEERQRFLGNAVF